MNVPPVHPFLGIELEQGEPGERTKVWMRVKPEHCNRGGFLHGGFPMLLMDAAVGFAASSSPAGEPD